MTLADEVEQFLRSPRICEAALDEPRPYLAYTRETTSADREAGVMQRYVSEIRIPGHSWVLVLHDAPLTAQQIEHYGYKHVEHRRQVISRFTSDQLGYYREQYPELVW